MSRKKSKKAKQIKSLLIEESPDDERLFLESLEELDPKAMRAKKEAVRQEERGGERPTSKAAAGAGGTWEVDLHRCTVDEAKQAVDRIVAEMVKSGRGEAKLKVITGKGLHSGPRGGVLAKEIHRYLAGRYADRIVSMEESPAEVKLGGLPMRGHFHVIFRR